MLLKIDYLLEMVTRKSIFYYFLVHEILKCQFVLHHEVKYEKNN